MARKWGMLRRFRLIAVPGAAGVAGVPADREATLREELAPIFAALRSAQEEATRCVAQARAESDGRLAHATEESRRLIEEARGHEASERVAGALSLSQSAQSDAASIRASASEEAQRITRLSSDRIPPIVSELVAQVMSSGVSTKTSS